MEHDRPIIAVTGSAGKTTTKEAISAILQTRWNILKTLGNHNTVWGVMNYATEISDAHQAVVLEYGMEAAGQIAQNCALIQPNISVITNVGSAHICNFDFNKDVSKLADAKSELILGMKPNGLLLLNADDKNSALLNTQFFKGNIVKVSMMEPSAYRAFDVSFNEQGLYFKVKLNNKTEQFHVDLLGRHNVYNVLFAIAAADYLGFSPSEMRAGLKCFKKYPRRLNLYFLSRNNKLIDDSYNENPHSMMAAIDVLTEIGEGKKIAILGGMLKHQINYAGYEAVSRKIVDSTISYLYTLDCDYPEPHAKLISDKAIELGFPAENVQHCPTHQVLFNKLAERNEKNAVFLVKGAKTSEAANYLRLSSLLFSPKQGGMKDLIDKYRQEKIDLI